MTQIRKATVPYPRLPHIRYFIMRVARTSTTSHIHEAFELLYMLEGECSVLTDQKVFGLKKGDMVIVNPNHVHYMECQDSSALLLTLQLSPFFEHDYLPDLKNVEFRGNILPATMDDKLSEEIKSIFCSAGLAYFSADNTRQYRCLALTTLLIEKLMEKLDYRERGESEYINEVKLSRRLQRILNYIQEHSSEPHLLQDVAKAEGLSTSYVSRLFSSNFGMTFQKYLMQLRLENAMRLLCTTNLPVYDICYECGFSDYRQLNKYCNEHFGKPAGACRSIKLIEDKPPIIPSHDISNGYDRYSDSASLEYLSHLPGIHDISIHID